MKFNSRIYDIIFIVSAAILLSLLNEMGYLEFTVLHFPLIWMMIAYYMGRAIERRVEKQRSQDDHAVATRSNT